MEFEEEDFSVCNYQLKFKDLEKAQSQSCSDNNMDDVSSTPKTSFGSKKSYGMVIILY